MAGDVQEQISGVVQAGKDALESVKEAGAEAQEGLRATAQQMSSALRREGGSFADEQRHRLSEQTANVGEVVRDTAQRLRDQECTHMAGYVESLADRIDGVARYIGETHVKAMIHDVEDLARERPEIFLGGMFLIGLAAARFFRAASPAASPYGYYEH